MPTKTPLRVLKDIDDVMHLLTGKRIRDVVPKAVELFGEDLVKRILKDTHITLSPDDPYAILEVRPDASDFVVNAVYRAKAKVLHPDNKETGNAEAFKRITAAYEQITKDRQTRGKG